MRRLRARIWVPALILLSATVPAGARGTRDSDRMQDKTFQSSAGPLKYLLFVPKDYSASRRYPLVVSLRGSGSTYKSATDGFEAAHPWIQGSIQAREPHFIMVPECNSGTWGGLAGAASNGVMATASKIVIEAVEDLKKQYSLDTNRFVLTGFSLGGSGTYHIKELMPDYWAGVSWTGAGNDSR